MSKRRIASGFSMKKGVAPLLFLATAFSGPAHVQASTARQDPCGSVDVSRADLLVRIPFEIVDGRIYVQARANGRGPFRFAVDTGASGMARADASLVSLLGLEIQGQTGNSDGVATAKVDMTHLDSLEVGGLARQNLDVITRDYNKRQSPDVAFLGIIARDFFSDGLLIIDYPNRVLSFTRARALSPAGKGVLSYERAFRVPVSIGEVQAEGNLDTGANVTFVLPQSLYEQVASGPLEQAGRGRLANVEIETKRSTIRGPFRIGNATLSDVEVRVSDRFPELLVGAHALQNLVLMIDQRSKTVAVCQ